MSSAFLETPGAATSEAQITSSQSIANAVLAGKRTGTTDMSQLATALSAGAGVPGNPIVVQLNERERTLQYAGFHLALTAFKQRREHGYHG